MVTSASGEWLFNFKAFENAITKNTKLVLLTNPHNPSGKMFTE
jgi:aspartate/methionine/tyrosine aminotransferase